MKKSGPGEFEKAAQEPDRGSFLGDFVGFLAQNKKWWLLPVVFLFLLLGLLVFLSGTGFAPFVYTLF